MKRALSVFMFVLLLVSMLTFSIDIRQVEATGTIYIRADGSIDPPDAPISTVDNVTYTLTGNITSDAGGIVVERSNIIIDGNAYTLQGSWSGNGFYLEAVNNVTIKNANIKSCYRGILLDSSSGNSISGNNITSNGVGVCGIRLDHSSNNSISGNNITANNSYGIYLYSSSNNTVSGNTFTNDGLVVWGSYQNSVENNTVNGRPLAYLEDVSNYTVDDAGQVVLVRCENIRVEGLNLSRTDIGIEFWQTSNSTISGNNITANNSYGIWLLYSSSYNSISGNNITNNEYGIGLDSSSGNSISGNNITNDGYYGIDLIDSSNNTLSGNNITNNVWGISLYYSSNYNSISHNNFINNTRQVYDYSWEYPSIPPSINVWDDGYPSGGNYWSDYTGIDEKKGLNQDESGSDGLGDTPYVIGADQDHYPLMYQWPPRHDSAIANVAISKTVVRQGYPIFTNVTAANQGDYDETFNVTVYANAIEIETKEVTLTIRNSTTIIFYWNTTDFLKGNYTLSAYAWPVENETYVDDNNFTGVWVFVTIPGDISGDQYVNAKDAVILGGAFYPTGTYNPNADINDDEYVNAKDAVILGTYFGQHW